MPKAFQAVPLSDLASAREAVAVMAETDLSALMQAKALFGDDVPFDLSEGERLVVTYRPTRVFSPVRLVPERQR